MYKTVILFSLFLLMACQDNVKNKTQQSSQIAQKMLDDQQDMQGADSFKCFSATVINQGEASTFNDIPAPNIAVLNKDKKYIVIGIGRDRIVLRTTGGDTLHLTGEREKHVLRAYRNAVNQEIDSVVIYGVIGQGRAILRYEKK